MNAYLPKPGFADLFARSGADRLTLYGDAARMGIPSESIDHVLAGSPVPVHHALCLLSVLSTWSGTDYQLNETTISVTPVSFSDLYTFHHFSLHALSVEASVTEGLLDRVLNGQPVLGQSAEDVIKAVAHMTGWPYTPEVVRILVLNEEEGDKTP